MTWADGPMLAFDTESTGTDVTADRIVTAAAVYIAAGPGKRQRLVRDWLICPGVPIPAEATAVHGINDAAAASGADPQVALAEIASVVQAAWDSGVPVVAFNATFDISLLDHELARHGFAALNVGHVIDPLVIDRAVDKYRKGKRTLEACCGHYGIDPGIAHDAGADAVAAARLAWYLAQNAEVANLTLAELHEKQAGWAEEWQTHFEQYLRTKGGQPDAVVERGWPLRSIPQDTRAVA